MIDIDAIPFNLAPQPVLQPVITLYEATVVSMPNGSVRLVPHYKGVVRQWAKKANDGAAPAAHVRPRAASGAAGEKGASG
jgi:hypothetical protein